MFQQDDPMYQKTTVGTCSLCGGAVTVPSVWMGVIPPVPTCDACGARAAAHGPVLPMVPAPPKQPSRTTNTTDSTGSEARDQEGFR